MLALAAMAVSGPAFAAMGACEGAYVKSDPQDQIRLYTICLDDLQEEAVAGAYHNRGVAYMRTGQLEQAMSDFDASLLYDNNYGLAYFNRAAVYAEQGQLTRAMADLDRTLELRPSRIHSEAHYRRGLLRQATGDYAGAIADFEEVMETNIAWLDPDRRQKQRQRASGALAKAYLLATSPEPTFRDGAQAVTLAESALEHGEPAEARAVLAAAYAEAGQMDAALREHALARQMAAEAGAAEDAELTVQLAAYQAGEPYRLDASACGANTATECRFAWYSERMMLSRGKAWFGDAPAGDGASIAPF